MTFHRHSISADFALLGGLRSRDNAQRLVQMESGFAFDIACIATRIWIPHVVSSAGLSHDIPGSTMSRSQGRYQGHFRF